MDWCLPNLCLRTFSFDTFELIFSFSEKRHHRHFINFICQSIIKPTVWKRYIDDILNYPVEKLTWDRTVHQTSKLTSAYNQKCTAEISKNYISGYKGKQFQEWYILDIRTHFNPTETFQYTHFSSRHLPRVKKGFVKGEALRLLWTNCSKTTYHSRRAL